MMYMEQIIEKWVDSPKSLSSTENDFLSKLTEKSLEQEILVFRGTAYYNIDDLRVGCRIDYSNRLTSWSISKSVAEAFAEDDMGHSGKDSVILIYNSQKGLDISNINEWEGEIIIPRSVLRIRNIHEICVFVE